MCVQDKYETIEQVQQAMRQAGLESSSLVLGIDCTASNAWTGSKSFHGQNLHQLNASVPVYNPYQQCIHVIGRTLSAFDDDHLIPMFGEGRGGEGEGEGRRGRGGAACGWRTTNLVASPGPPYPLPVTSPTTCCRRPCRCCCSCSICRLRRRAHDRQGRVPVRGGPCARV